MGKKKKGFDPFDETLKVGQVGAGTVMATGMPYMIGKGLPGTSNTMAGVSKASGSLSILPVIQGGSSVFGSLRYLQGSVKNKKNRRR